jgi:hypothetical protein
MSLFFSKNFVGTPTLRHLFFGSLWVAIIRGINRNLKVWLKGFIIAELSAVPIIILFAKADLKSMVPILIYNSHLGQLGCTLLKQVHKKYITNQ